MSKSNTSAAETAVFGLLAKSDLEPNAYSLHSLNISEHDYKLVGELDFVVVSPWGILVLEVKGGHVARYNGVWTFTDRYGHEHRKSEGPFEQARSGMFALRDRLARLFGETVFDFRFGFGVLFPDHAFDIASVEWAQEMVFDSEDRRKSADLRPYIRRLQGYWAGKTNGRNALSPEDIEGIRRILRPSFDRLPSLRVRADRLVSSMESLTEEQYASLDLLEGNPRVLYSGGAGTGKTFIAAEAARREANRGRSVLVVCASPVLAAFLDSRIAMPGVTIKSAEPNAQTLTPSAKTPDKFDVLIVDEGQDLINFTSLSALEGRLRGGFAAGSWYVFYDSNRQTGLVGRFEREALEYLLSCGAVAARLTRNCRNTTQIVTQVQLVTAADIGVPIAGEGPPVSLEFHGSSPAEARALEKRLAKLGEEGIPPGDITILSPVTIDQSCVRNIDLFQRGFLQVLNPIIAANWPPSSITYSTVADFKGLENNFVLLVDVSEVSDEGLAANTIYVAMSRARVGLWLTVPNRLRARLTAIMTRNVARIALSARSNDPISRNTR